MSDSKPTRLTSLLQSRARRAKARQRIGKQQLGAESLEDRLVLANSITFDPTPGALDSGDETIISSSLNFDEGNLLIVDYADLVAGTIDTTKVYVQNSAKDLGLMGSEYEISGVIEADVKMVGTTLMGAGTGGTLTLYYDAANNSDALAGTGYVDGTEILKATFDADGFDGSPLLIDTTSENFDQHETNNYIGVKTDDIIGGIDIDGTVMSVHATFLLDPGNAPLTPEDFHTFNYTAGIKAPFVQTDPSMQFELAGGGIVVPSIVSAGDDNGVDDLQMQTDGTSAFELNGDIIVQKFLDDNGDGDSTGDAPMAGVEFTISGEARNGDPIGPLTGVTGANGRYAFENVPPGSYTVTEDVPAGFVSTTGAVQLTELESQEIVTVNFGNAVPGSIHGFKCEDLDIDGMCGPRLGADPHVVFVLDYSGSTEDDSGVDLDGDGTNESVLDLEKASVAEAIQFMTDFGINAEIGVVAFDGGTSTAALDMDPTAGTLSFTSPTADLDGNGVADVLDALDTVAPAGLTNYEVALETAAALLEPWGAPAANSHVVFISDGVPTEGETLGDLADEVAALAALSDNIRAFGIASADLTHLQAIDPGAMIFTSPADLASVFSSVVAGVDPPLPGIVFNVYDADGNLDGTGTTNDDGEFWINDLLPGTYTVCEAANPEYVSTTHNHVTLTTASGDVDCLATQTLTITSGQEFAYQEGAAHLGAVVGQHVFYNDSAWDGDGLTLSAADDAAIATDKTAFDGTGTATFANYTSYFNGINGVMVDIEHGIGTGATLADFEFRWSPTPSSNDATTWPLAAAPTMAVRAGAGDGGSDRYSFSWANGTLKNGWLQVVVKANANTGIQMDNIHYWGNAAGETGNMVGDTMVNAADISGVVNNPVNVATTPSSAAIDNDYDLNRDKMVNAADISVVVNNPANGLTVPQLTLLHDPTQQGMGTWKKEIVVGNDLVFGNTVPGSIHGFKFVDVDADGVYDPAVDRPWEGIEFELTGTDDLGNDVNRSTLTDDDGEFWFESLVPGMYTVTEVLPDEAVASTPTSTTGEILAGQEFVWREGAAHLPNDSRREEVVVGEVLMFGNYVPGSIHGFKCEDLNLDGVCEPRVIGDDPHIVFTVDYSASTLDDSGVDLDGDGTNETVLEVEIASVTHFVEWLASQSINAEIGVVAFHGAFPPSDADAVQLDMDPTGGTLLFTTPTADLDGNGVSDVVDALNSEAAGGLTNYQAALNVTTDLLAQWDGQANLPEDGYVIFISDGTPTVGDTGDDLADEVAALSAYADHIRAFGINSATLEDLQPIDPNAEFFSDPSDLMDIFTFLAEMAGDPPMPNVPFDLVDSNGDVVATELTNDQGEFWFTGLKPDHYTVREGDLAAAFPDDNVMPTPGTPSEVEIWVGSHEEHVWRKGAAMIPDGSLRQELPPNENLIFTNFVKGSIHGFKYHDVRPDGEPYDPANDPAFPGIGFILLDATGAQVGDVEVTNENGEFWFTDLVPGDYTVVELDHPSGQVKSSTHTSADVTVGSGQEIVWREGAARLPDGSLREEIVQPWDLSFGNYVLASVHGFKFEDNNANGVYDPDIDEPWAGFEFLLESDHDGDGLYGADDPDGEFSEIQVSDENGEFWFINLEPCQYRLSEINLPDGVIQSPEKFLEIFIDSGEEIVWKPGAAMLEPEFLDVPALVPGLNSHWVEVEGPPFDGPFVPHTIGEARAVLALGPGDDGFVAEADLMVTVIDFADGEYDEAKTSTVFDPPPFGGDDPVFAVEYSGFIEIPADGDYVFSLVHDDGFELTIGGSVVASFDADTAPITTEATVTLTAGTHSFELVSWEQGGLFINELAWKPPGADDFSLPGDGVFFKDGTVQVPNPKFLDSSIKKEFFLDPDGNGVWDELTFGNYVTGSIHGFKFQDHNVNGVYDPENGDEPLGGILFELVQDGNVIATQGSNILGEFWFTNLIPGTYTVRENLDHLGVTATTPTEVTIQVGSREEWVWQDGAAMLPPDSLKHEILADADGDGTGELLMFGNAIMGSIHGFKFEDYNGNGIYEPDADTDAGTDNDDGRDQNDKPWANFPFEIIGDIDGDGDTDTISTVTDENGEFWLRAFPGEYTIREKLEDVHEDVVPTTYRDPSGEATFFVGSGEELVWRPGAATDIGRLQTEVFTPGLAFGNAYVGSMHGCVYNDVNGNGVVDPEDMVQGGVELEITNSAGDVVDTMMTWVDGLYWFTELYPDTYTVTAVNLPAGVNLIADVTEFVGSREELVHVAGAAELGPADPQHEVDLGSRLFVFVQRPNAAPAALEAEFLDVVQPDLVDGTQLHSLESQAQLMDASLASYADERDNLTSEDVADDDDHDDLFALLATDHWFLS